MEMDNVQVTAVRQKIMNDTLLLKALIQVVFFFFNTEECIYLELCY